MKRPNYITWDEYFMSIACLSAKRSKDPNSQIGCCIVSENKIILSTGYNGFPRNCSDDDFNWNSEANDDLGPKYDYVVHAELNAILNAEGKNLKGASLYTLLFPCNECAKAIIQAGISEVIYLSSPETKSYLKFEQSKQMFNASGVKLRQFNLSDDLEYKDDQVFKLLKSSKIN